MQTNNRERQKIMMKSVKPKAWSHQAELANLKGRQVTALVHAGGHTITIEGELLDADQFTLKIRRKGPLSVIVLNKSSVIYWAPIEAKQREEMN